METRKALVDRAITFGRPQRVPIVFWNRDQAEGDVMLYHLSLGCVGGGRQCFMVPISYQTDSISGTPEEIHAEARRMYDLLGTEAGGFIGYVEEYGCMGMSQENYRACGEAFRCLSPATRLGEQSATIRRPSEQASESTGKP